MEFGVINAGALFGSGVVWQSYLSWFFVGPALFLASFAGSMIANLLTWLPVQIIPIGGGISFVVAILLDIALFMLLYMLLPHGASTWRDFTWRD